jgi:hypothetical protein
MGALRPACCPARLFLRYSRPCGLYWLIGCPAPCASVLDPFALRPAPLFSGANALRDALILGHCMVLFDNRTEDRGTKE